MNNQRFLIIDGSSYLYRAFHSAPPLTNSSNEPTGTIYSVINMIKSLITKYPSDFIAVIFDAKGPSFRKEIYAEYKSNRPPMPDELRSQIEPIRNIIKGMGLPIISEPGVEADDVIGTLSCLANKQGISVLISTGDKDMAQLVNEQTTLINTMNNEITDIEKVEKKFGVKPQNIIDYLALMGDTSDNIPGVEGIGEKSASQLISTAGGIHDIYSDLEKVKELPIRGAKSLYEKLKENKDNAFLSYKLATIIQELELKVSIENLTESSADENTLKNLYEKYEFNKWLNDLEIVKSQKKEISLDVVIPENSNDLLDLRSKLNCAEKFFVRGIFHEENVLHKSNLVGVSILVDDTYFYLPIYDNHSIIHNVEEFLSILKPAFESHHTKVISDSLKPLITYFFKHFNITIKKGISTNLMSFATNIHMSKHELVDLSEKLLGITLKKKEDLLGKGKKKLSPLALEAKEVGNFEAMYNYCCSEVYNILDKKISNSEIEHKLLHKIDLPTEVVLAKMEANGVLIDNEKLDAQNAELIKSIKEIENKAFDLVGEKFNLKSPKAVSEIFFEKLNMPHKGRGKSKTSTKDEYLQSWAADGYEIAKLLIKHRQLSKLMSTYTSKLPSCVDSATGRIHCNYNQTITKTSRLSADKPNLQNIPIKTTEGSKVREAFIAEANYKILDLDFSQVELRILAHLSNDKNLINCFKNNVDVHKVTASEIFNVALEDVTQEQRNAAKAINFGLIYGKTAFGLANDLGISKHQAEDYISKYFARYPSVASYLKDREESDNIIVENAFGRKASYPDIKASNGLVRKAAIRQAINSPMQSTSADIIKIAMIKCQAYLNSLEKGSGRMIMQVHDELVFEVREDKAGKVEQDIKSIMEGAVKLVVPMTVSSKVANNWLEAH